MKPVSYALTFLFLGGLICTYKCSDRVVQLAILEFVFSAIAATCLIGGFIAGCLLIKLGVDGFSNPIGYAYF